MKWLVLTVCFCVLAGATCAVWNQRFQTQTGRELVIVDDGTGGGFAVEKAVGAKPFARLFALPLGGPVEALRIRLSHRAVDLVPDGEKWKDGRLILEWRNPEGLVVARDTVLTMQKHDKKSRSADMIVPSVEPGLVPALRVEHLGLSGRMEIHSLQAVAVREGGWVKWAAGGLVGLWGMWCYAFARGMSGSSWPRVACVAAILVAMGWFLAVPGPWAHIRPLAGSFRAGEDPHKVAVVVFSESGGPGQNVEALPKLAPQGSWLYQVKRALSFLRPVLHVLLFAVPALAMALLCGGRCAWCCGVLISCAVELGQLGFGFGFDWVDAIDLLVDWSGIAAALWVLARYKPLLLHAAGCRKR